MTVVMFDQSLAENVTRGFPGDSRQAQLFLLDRNTVVTAYKLTFPVNGKD